MAVTTARIRKGFTNNRYQRRAARWFNRSVSKARRQVDRKLERAGH